MAAFSSPRTVPLALLQSSKRLCGNCESRFFACLLFLELRFDRPDIKRYFHDPPFNLVSEKASTVNPAASYPTWVAYISAFLKSYHHVISIHPSVAFLRHLLEPLQHLIDKLDTGEVQWVRALQQETGLRARLWHRDLHFGNILADHDGLIHGVIDWEFAGTGVSIFSKF